MASDYPGALPRVPATHQDVQDDVAAIAAELGTNPSGAETTVAAAIAAKASAVALAAETTRATAAEALKANTSDVALALAAKADTSALAGLQPLDTDLTAIAALTTTTYGRAFLALADAAAGRTALGLGTAATTAASAYEVAGTAAAAQAASQPLDSDLTAIAALSTTAYGRALLTQADAAAGRTALQLGTAATTNSTAYEVAGAAAAAQAASQPLDSDLTAIAALTTTTYGRALLTQADAAAGRTNLGLATVAATGAYSDLSGKPITGYTPVTKTTTYTAADGDLVLADATSAAFSVTLPTPTAGRRVATKKTDASTNAVSVITGAGTVVLAVQNQAQEFVADGTLWHSIARPGVTSIAATGTASGTTYLRGDGAWATPTGGGGSPAGALLGVDPIIGKYFSAQGPWTGDGFVTMSNGDMRLLPVDLSRALTVDRIATAISSAGSAGSLIRFGIYAADSSGAPGALILDAGTATSTSAADVIVIISQALSIGRYFLVAVPQGAPATNPNVRAFNTSQAANLAYSLTGPMSAGPALSIGQSTYVLTGVTGALPGSAAAATYVGLQLPQVWLRAAS